MINESIPQNGETGRADMEKQDRKRRRNVELVERGGFHLATCGTFPCQSSSPGLFCDPYIAATSLEGGKSSQARTDNHITVC